ncbi:MAG: hypothetical protein ACI4IF_02280 [Acutalibacteraceae bacterium]
MKKFLSLILSVLIVLSMFSCFGMTVFAIGNPSDLFIVNQGELSNGEITYTVSLKAGTYLSGTVIFAEYDTSVLSVKSAGPVMTKDSGGDPIENVSGMYESGKAVAGDNLYSVGYIHGGQADYIVGDSDKKFIEFTFKVKDASKILTSVKFICYDYSSIQKPSNNIPNGSILQIALFNLVLVPDVVLNEPVADSSGITISWNDNNQADGFIVYRKSVGDWNQIATLDGSVKSYKDTDVINNTAYSYVVKPFVKDSENEVYTNEVNSETKYIEINYHYHIYTVDDWIIDKEANCTEDGLKHKECTVCGEVLESETIRAPGHDYSTEFIVDKVATCTENGSKSHHCSRCDSKTDVTEIPLTGHTSSDWITDKEATVNGAGSKHKECTVCKVVLETATIPQLKCSEPKLTKIENASNGIKITWGKVTGAQSYNVYRKTYSNGKWSGWSGIKYGVTGTSYTDTTAKSGTTYAYTVRAKNAAGLSSYNTTGLKIKFLSTPKLTSISNGSGKVSVKWNKVTGASGYYVYRQTYSNGKWSGWKKVATTKDNYYNDTKVSSSNYYKYTVRAYNGSYMSYYNTTGLKTKYLAAPKISSASSRRDGILINWNKISGASGYYVYRKAPSGDWKKIATVKGNTTIKYLDETPRKGVTYQYCVKAYSGNYTSTYANTYKITCKY